MYQPVQYRRRLKKCCALKLEWLEDRRLLSGQKTILAAPLLSALAASEAPSAAVVRVINDRLADQSAPADGKHAALVLIPVQEVTTTNQQTTSSDSAPMPLDASLSVHSLKASRQLDNTQNSITLSANTQASPDQSSLPGFVQDVTTTSQDPTSSALAPVPSDTWKAGHRSAQGEQQVLQLAAVVDQSAAVDVSAADGNYSLAVDGQAATDVSAADAQPTAVIDQSAAINVSAADGNYASDSLAVAGQAAADASAADAQPTDSSASQVDSTPVANTVQAASTQSTPPPVKNVSGATPIVAAVVRINSIFAGSSPVTDAGVASSTDLQSKHAAATDQQGRLAAGQDQSWLAPEMALAARKAADAVAAVEQQTGNAQEKIFAETDQAMNLNHDTAYLGHTGQGKGEEASAAVYGYFADLQTLAEPPAILMLKQDAQQGDTGSDVSDLSAQGSDLVTGFSSAGRAALDVVLQDFVQQLNHLGQDLSRSLGGLGLSPWLLTAAVAVTVCEIGRRQRRSARSVQGLTASGEPTTLTWFAGLPGPLSTEES